MPRLCFSPAQAPFALGLRRKLKGRDRRMTELALVIRQTLEGAVLVDRYARSQIDVVLQARRCCCCGVVAAPPLVLRASVDISGKFSRAAPPLTAPACAACAARAARQVLQGDGGQRSCAVNAASMALADAGVQMRDVLAACGAGLLDNTPLLDLNYEARFFKWTLMTRACLPAF